jgi:heme-degrading monooxygenase HmoA
MLVDREAGHCIVTSSWESEEAMRASDAHLRPSRERARELMNGTVEVEEWRVAVMHRNHHGECCRVSWLTGDLEAMTEAFRMGILPDLDRTAGFCGASLLVDESTGMGCATSAWESRAAMEASRAAVDEMRQRAASEAGGTIVDVHEFELAYAHLNVPEMA